MPEGDTIFRTAATLRRWLEGAEVTEADTGSSRRRGPGLARLVGQTVAAVESRGKHLLCWFEPSDLALHTHMRMSGSWHVYRPGEPWRRPRHLATVVLAVEGAVAVCFSAPVAELLSRAQVSRHPVLSALGPDLLAADVDLDVVRARLEASPEVTVGEVLLDQRILAGVGNVLRSEILFLRRIDPWVRVGDLDAGTREVLVETARRLLTDNVGPGTGRRATTGARGGGGAPLYVYGRARRPCLRCHTPIRVGRHGAQGRVVYWCPRCQSRDPCPETT